MKKILLTGGTGLIGKKIGQALEKAGYEINVISRNKAKAESELPFSAGVIEGDLTAGSVKDPALQQVEGVIHLAGENIGSSRWTEKKKQKILLSRTETTRHLIESLKDSPRLKVFVSASAVGIYGSRGEESLTENSSTGDGFLAQVCQRWEGAASAITKDIRCVFVRTGMVLSPDGGALEKMIKPFQWGLGAALGDGQQWVSWIHMDDLVQIYLQLLADENIRGAINAVSNQPVRNQELSQEIASQLGKNLIPNVPKAVLKVMLGEMSQIVLDSQKVLPARLVEKGFQFRYPDIHLAIKDCLEKRI